MRDEPLALSTRPPVASAETDYDAICAAVTATARGRWFLDEFARRNRNSDTLQVLDAIARMEAAVVGDRTQQAARQAHQEVRVELLEMARTIALTRAEMAESQSEAAQAALDELANAPPATGIADAAERLRQIAWTMRACGVELAASDQIGQIADAILAANAFRDLDDQKTHKLSEALQYLENRIDRMLDSRLAAAAEAVERVAQAPQISGRDREAAPEPEPRTAAAIGAAIFAAAAAVEAETEPAVAPANDDIPPASISVEAAPAPVLKEAAPEPVVEQALPAPVLDEAARAAAPDEAASSPLPEEAAQAPVLEAAVPVPEPEEAAAASVPEEAAPVTVSSATEYLMDDDVVLTVADVVIDVEPTLPSIDLGPAFFAASTREPTPLPAMNMAPTSFAESAPAPTPMAASVAPEPSPISPSKAGLQAFQVGRVELEVEPPFVAPASLAGDEVDEPEPPIAPTAMVAPFEAAAPTAEDETETAFAGLDLEPLMAVPAITDEPQPEAQTEAHLAAGQVPDEDLLIAAPIFDDVAGLVDALTADLASPGPAPETDFGADDEPPQALATHATATDWPDLPEPVAAIEPIARAAAFAEPHDAPPPSAVDADTIAMQVDYDLDGLTDFVPNAIAPTTSQRSAAASPRNPTPASDDDDPADFLLEALPINTPPRATLPESAPLAAPAATTQLSSELFTNALAAIETELRAGTPLGAGANAAPGAGANAGTPPPITDSALAALMAMSEEERIALFS